MTGRLGPVVTEGGGGPEHTHMICGFLGYDERPFNPLLAALPPLVHLRRPAAPDRLDVLVDFALAESRDPRAGGQCVLLRLSELMFVEVVRRYVAALPEVETGWLAALREPAVGRALGLLHAQPARAWTLETLARAAGLSRSTLAERFALFMGQPPMHYLARWRMQLAARRLAEGGAKVQAVALEVGYDSEAAFSRAFKKIVGTPPAEWRRRAAAGAARRA
jgi:AraC-like DNA-binding protein